MKATVGLGLDRRSPILRVAQGYAGAGLVSRLSPAGETADVGEFWDSTEGVSWRNSLSGDSLGREWLTDSSDSAPVNYASAMDESDAVIRRSFAKNQNILTLDVVEIVIPIREFGQIHACHHVPDMRAVIIGLQKKGSGFRIPQPRHDSQTETYR